MLADRREPVAFDIGPANALMDAVVTWLSDGRERFDADGQRAARGLVDEPLLASLLDEPYYLLSAPKSTGKELFNLDYVLAALAGREIELDDLVATLSELTVKTVARALSDRGVTEVVAAGGGTRNPNLMSRLRGRLPDVKFRPLQGLRGS